VVVHADLGRVEWDGVPELAGRQAAHYGLRFEIVEHPDIDLLERIELRGRWPDAKNRYCTSEFKRNQVYKLMTQLVRELDLDRPVKILNCMGLRAAESPARAKRPAFAFDERASNKTRRHVWEWLPIHAWSTAQVWQRIRASGVPYHPVYDQGMPRLSCSFCVFASRSQLVLAAQLRPDLATEYAAAEARMGHRFRMDLSMADVVAAAGVEQVDDIEDWAA